MTQQTGSQSISHLQNLFNQRSPKTKFFTESRVQQFTQSIAKQIVNGDTVVNPNRDSSVGKPKNRYEEQKKRQKLIQASQQKQDLQRKLSYVNRSIQSIKKYSYLKAESQQQTLLNRSRSKSPEELESLRQKDRQLTRSIKKHKEMIEKYRQQEQLRKRLQAQKSEQQRKKAEKQEKEQRKKQILQNLKKIKQQMESRQIDNKKSTQKIKELKSKKQLFHKMEEEWKEKQIMTLEQRKRKLSEIRNLHKPIDINEIKEHEKKVQQLRREKQDIRVRQKKINSSSIHYQVPYMGSFYKQILEKKAQNNDPLASSKIKIDKIKQFSEHIRQNFVPQIDERRKQELEKSIEKEAQMKRLRQQKLQETIQLRKNKGVEYLEYLRKIPKKRNQSKVQQQGSKTARPVYKNYLQHSSESPNKTQRTWTKILTKKELNKKQKARLLQYESQKVQQILRRKQQEGRLLKKNNEDDIDQEYYNMIKAKLSLLTSEG